MNLRAITFNCWLLRTPCGISIAKDIPQRMALIAERLSQSRADIVFLQECWLPEIRRYLSETLNRFGFQYSTHQERKTLPIANREKDPRVLTRFLRSLKQDVLSPVREIMGDGLITLSKYPLKEIQRFAFDRYTRNDEQFVKKGLLRATVEVPHVGDVDVLNAHIGAVTFHPKSRDYVASEIEARHDQVRQMKKWITDSRTSEFGVLGVDLNTHYHEFIDGNYGRDLSAEFAEMINPSPYGAGMIDTFTFTNGIQGTAAFTDTVKNPYKSGGVFSASPDGTLDYLFSYSSRRMVPRRSLVIFAESLKGEGQPPRLSDHYGVMTDFQIC